MSLKTRIITSDNRIYDPASKGWIAVFAVIIAGIIDWFSVVMQVQHNPPKDIAMSWWWVALAIALFPPLCWAIGDARRRQHKPLIIWTAVAIVVLVAQLLVLKWGNG